MHIGCTSEPNDFKHSLNEILVRSLQTQIYIMVSNITFKCFNKSYSIQKKIAILFLLNVNHLDLYFSAQTFTNSSYKLSLKQNKRYFYIVHFG